MNVAEQLVETLLEGDDDKKMPDWLHKKIHGKSDEDEGGESKDEEGGEKAEKSSGSKSSKSTSGTDVASVTGKVSYSA